MAEAVVNTITPGGGALASQKNIELHIDVGPPKRYFGDRPDTRETVVLPNPPLNEYWEIDFSGWNEFSFLFDTKFSTKTRPTRNFLLT